MCCGHDVTNLIAMVYRQRWASVEVNMDVKKVESALRLAYRDDDFYQTNLFSSVNNYLERLGVVPATC